MREVYLFNTLSIKSFIKKNRKYSTSNQLICAFNRTQLYLITFFNFYSKPNMKKLTSHTYWAIFEALANIELAK